jgi:hypothetical protein
VRIASIENLLLSLQTSIVGFRLCYFHLKVAKTFRLTTGSSAAICESLLAFLSMSSFEPAISAASWRAAFS